MRLPKQLSDIDNKKHRPYIGYVACVFCRGGILLIRQADLKDSNIVANQ